MSDSTATTISFDAPRMIAPEDQSRADFYALLAALFYRAPEERLLQAITIAEPPLGQLNASWQTLSAAASVMPQEALDAEYSACFVGMGRPPVMLYGSYYIAGFMMEKPLAELRTALSALGYSRAPNVLESEDHIAALCDVMRAMILGDIRDAPHEIAAQQQFFMNHMNPWLPHCMKAITEYHQSNFYKHVATFASTFFAIEKEAFSMMSSN